MTDAVTAARDRIAPRTGTDRLPSELGERYGVEVTAVTELDLGVFRAQRADGSALVARVFSPSRPAAAARHDAEVLRFLEGRDYPAERCVAGEPVFELDGQSVVVTGFVDGVGRDERSPVIKEHGGLRALGGLLAHLSTMDDAPNAPGGAWHHLAEGSPTAEVTALRELIADAAAGAPARQRRGYETLRSFVDGLEDCARLPEGLLHPDFVLPNVIASREHGMVLIDWAGAGRGPRLWPLAWLLFAEGARDVRRIDRVLEGYRRHVTLDPAEVARLPAAIASRPVMLEAWSAATGRRPVTAAVQRATDARDLATAIAGRAQAAAQ